MVGLLDFSISNFRNEAIYYCVDTTRAPGVFHMLNKFGIPIPPEVIQAISEINKIQNTLNFLNIQFRFEGMLITTGSYYNFNVINSEPWLND